MINAIRNAVLNEKEKKPDMIYRADLIAKLSKIPGYCDEEGETLVLLRDIKMLVKTIPAVDE